MEDSGTDINGIYVEGIDQMDNDELCKFGSANDLYAKEMKKQPVEITGHDALLAANSQIQRQKLSRPGATAASPVPTITVPTKGKVEKI